MSTFTAPRQHRRNLAMQTNNICETPRGTSRLPTPSSKTSVSKLPRSPRPSSIPTTPISDAGRRSPSLGFASVVSSSSPRAPLKSRLPKSPGPKIGSAAYSPFPTAGVKSRPPVTPQYIAREAAIPKSGSPKTQETWPSFESPPKTPCPAIVVTPMLTKDSEPRTTDVVPAVITAPSMDSRKQASPTESSPYIAAHVGEPCTIKALDHMLDCGHKIITAQPEPCAENCKGSYSMHANPKSIDKPFACLVCITREQQIAHKERVAEFTAEISQVAKFTKKKDPEAWIEAKVGFMSKAWQDLQNEEMITAAKQGRFCYPVFVAAEHEDLMLTVVSERLQSSARAKVAASKARQAEAKAGSSNAAVAVPSRPSLRLGSGSSERLPVIME